MMTGKKDRAHPQDIDRFGQKFEWRCRVATAAEDLKLLEDVAGERMGNDGGIGIEVEPREPLWSIVPRGKHPHNVEQFLFGESYQRATQQCAERKRITPIGEHARDGDEVLHLLPPEQALTCLSSDRNAPALKRF